MAVFPFPKRPAIVEDSLSRMENIMPDHELELRPRHCTVDGCACQQWQWDGRPSALKSDPPSGCRCGHPTSRHSFIPRTTARAVP